MAERPAPKSITTYLASKWWLDSSSNEDAEKALLAVFSICRHRLDDSGPGGVLSG